MTAVLESLPVLHPKVQRWVTLAQDLNWTVTEKRGILTLVSPGGGRVKVPAQPKPEQFASVERQVAASGLQQAASAVVTAAAEERVQTARDALPNSAPKVVFQEGAPAAAALETVVEGASEYDPLSCPECAQAAVGFIAKNVQGLGAHRSKRHSVKGTSVRRPRKPSTTQAAAPRPTARATAVSALDQARAALDAVAKQEGALQARILELETRVAQAESAARAKDTAAKEAKKQATSAERALAAEKRFGDKVVKIMLQQDLSPLRMITEITKAAPQRFQ